MSDPKRYGLIRRRIRSLKQAHQFLRDLFDMGLLFHPEDSPDSVTNPLGDYLFTQDESDLLAQRIGEVYDFDQDPCAFCLTLTTSLSRDEPEPLKPYTVLLLRPDQGDPRHSTFLAHVDASDPCHAQALAQQQAWEADREAHCVVDNLMDYQVLCVFSGHLQDLTS